MYATVDGRVVKRPRGGNKLFKTQHFGLVVKIWLNGDRAGSLGERGDSWSRRSGSGTWKFGTSMAVASACVS
jgi:hypothetical protein